MTTNFPSITPSKQDIDLWLLDIHQCTQAHFSAAEKFMSTDERERAAKFLRGKETFIASRWLMRKVLSTYTNLSPAGLMFKRNAQGKPFLDGYGVEFSLSHSDHWVLLAVGDKTLGVDIEVPQKTRDFLGIAQHFFHPREYTHLRELEETSQRDYFYRLWTLKEAFFKAIGTGISAGLDKIQFSWDGDILHAELLPGFQQIPADQWQFFQAQQNPGLYVALAYQSPAPSRINWRNALDLSPE